MPLNPLKEALDDPSALVPTQSATVLRLAFSGRSVRRNHFCALGPHLPVELIAVIRFVADQVLRLRFDHVKVECQLNERDRQRWNVCRYFDGLS